jgi:hypothetical protein
VEVGEEETAYDFSDTNFIVFTLTSSPSPILMGEGGGERAFFANFSFPCKIVLWFLEIHPKN